MRKFTPILLSVTILVIVSLACGLPSIPVTGPTLDANVLGTAIMQTMVVAATQTAGALVPVDLVNSPTPTPTLMLTLEPSLTPSPTLSPTPLLTNTPLIPVISVSKATNCRVGPGMVYDRIGALMVGETAEIVARNPDGKYWYIKNPDQKNGYCWLWGEYATVSGNTGVLPVYTPPPTPTPLPGFDAEFVDLEDCNSWWLNIELTNTGGISFQSISLTISDMQTDTDLSLYADEFLMRKGCRNSATKDVLHPGERFTVSTPAFAENPDGHKMRANIKLCSAAGQNGTCVTKVIKFTP